MNHVAHCFLSFADDDLLFGNFIGDFVKGRAWQQYAPGVQKGILLHRRIDAFTDEHPATHASVARLRPLAGRYTAPVVDILFDHLLCRQWNVFAPTLPFDEFADWVYTSLEGQIGHMPPDLQIRWPHMRSGRFLHGYQSREGMEWVLGQFSRRLGYSYDATELSRFFFEEIEAFAADFSVFFPDLIEYSNQFRILNS